MVEINLDTRIKSLPYELQKKIYNYSIMHHSAKIIQELIKETDELNNSHFCIDTLKYKKLTFFNILHVLGDLKGIYDFDDLIWLLSI
tara:strand:+ start:335 stop:595 length:261 start_codon:yes stop_codon:yes gene_type:complete